MGIYTITFYIILTHKDNKRDYFSHLCLCSSEERKYIWYSSSEQITIIFLYNVNGLIAEAQHAVSDTANKKKSLIKPLL